MPQTTPLFVRFDEIVNVGPRDPAVNEPVVVCSGLGETAPGGTLPAAKFATTNLRPGSPAVAK